MGFFFSSRRRHTRLRRDWSSDVCSSDLGETSERLAKLDDLLKNAHAHTRSFVGLLFQRRREEVLLQIGVAFEQRLLEERGAAKGVVESARPLDPAELEALSKDLSRRLGKDVTLTGRVDPTLVGGVRVLVGARRSAERRVGTECRSRWSPYP